MADIIDYFDAPPFEWLSNFYPCIIEYEGERWTTTEHAFQAAKTRNVAYRRRIRLSAGPGEAKALGQWTAFERNKIALVPNWDTIKYDVMLDLLRLKFSQPWFRSRLLLTGNSKLIEGNTWSDTCWGVCDGVGANNLGRSLMLVRAELLAANRLERLNEATSRADRMSSNVRAIMGKDA